MCSILYFSCVCSQKIENDSLKINKLEEVVLTTQFEPQSLKKSVHNVRIITAQDIQNLAANNLGDVLNQYINITVRPSSNSGKSTISMFGLDAEYFKILVDNIPIVNEGGLGNNTDLSQINLNDIEQIEIIEGSMGVTHGANAVTGILNIITKKSSKNKWNVSATIQEETVGDEYELFDQGRHIQSLKIGHSINNHWFVSINSNHNDFRGYLGDRNGKYHLINDDTRGYNWLPRELWNNSALLSYKKNSFRAFYKFEWLDDVAYYYDSAANSNYSAQLGSYKYGNDERYYSNRFYHHLNAAGKIKNQIKYNISLSHQYQKRETETLIYNITYDFETENNKRKDQSMEVYYSIGNFSNFFKSNKVRFQLGYESVLNRGFAIVDEDDNQEKNVRKEINNLDFFAVSEVKITDNTSLRPGARYSVQSMFDNQYAISLGSRFLLPKDFELRVSVGKSYRTPTFEELYNRMVFTGHIFIGNENLIPETSMSYETNLKKQSFLGEGVKMSNQLVIGFIDVKDKITSAITGFDGATPIYENINISKYQSINFAITNQLQTDKWKFALGASLTGISQEIDNLEFKSDDKFLYNFNLNSNISYTVPKWKTTFSTYYKYTGKTQQYIGTSDDGYVLSELNPYSWLDASIRKLFCKDKIEFTLGARNLFDIDSVDRTNTSQSGGHGSSSQTLLAYGRSYFFKLTYNLNI